MIYGILSLQSYSATHVQHKLGFFLEKKFLILSLQREIAVKCHYILHNIIN